MGTAVKQKSEEHIERLRSLRPTKRRQDRMGQAIEESKCGSHESLVIQQGSSPKQSRDDYLGAKPNTSRSFAATNKMVLRKVVSHPLSVAGAMDLPPQNFERAQPHGSKYVQKPQIISAP